VRLQLGLRVRHPDGAQGSGDARLPRQRRLAVAALAGAARFGFDWRLTALLVALGASGLVVLGIYRKRILEH